MKNIIPPSFLLRFLWKVGPKPGIRNWLSGNEMSSFVLDMTKKSAFILSVQLVFQV